LIDILDDSKKMSELTTLSEIYRFDVPLAISLLNKAFKDKNKLNLRLLNLENLNELEYSLRYSTCYSYLNDNHYFSDVYDVNF
jgi:hypothetical protein